MLNGLKFLVRLILDGFGDYSASQKNNIIGIASTPCWDQWQQDYGQPHTARPAKPFTLIYVCGDAPLVSSGCWSDLTPTMLAVLGVKKTIEMTGKSLLKAA